MYLLIFGIYVKFRGSITVMISNIIIKNIIMAYGTSVSSSLRHTPSHARLDSVPVVHVRWLPAQDNLLTIRNYAVVMLNTNDFATKCQEPAIHQR